MTLVALTLLGGLSGCGRGANQGGSAEPLVVPVARPVKRPVTDFVDYTGRTNAIFNNSIQPRVTGFIKETHFKEGDIVRKDDILFLIDPRPYEALYKAAKSQKEVNEAKLRYDAATNERYKALYKKDKTAVSERELDQYQALEDQSKANLDLAIANLESPTLNLSWTKVTSPIDGQVSRFYLTKENLVEANSSQLTTVMSIDPMYVYFDMDEPTLLRIKKSMHGGKAPVYIGLQGEPGFMDPETGKPRHEGNIDFVDNKINAGTDSISVRGKFDNPEVPTEGALPSLPFAAIITGFIGSVGANWPQGPLPFTSVMVRRGNANRLLVPGMFVRVRFPVGQEEVQLLVNDRAIISEQGQKKIFVVNNDNKVEERIVNLGPLLDDGLRVVSGKNLKETDWVMFTALQQVRPGMEVKMEQRTMPELGKQSEKLSKK
jgi:multidrug efflux system membrane fusion protein